MVSVIYPGSFFFLQYFSFLFVQKLEINLDLYGTWNRNFLEPFSTVFAVESVKKVVIKTFFVTVFWWTGSLFFIRIFANLQNKKDRLTKKRSFQIFLIPVDFHSAQLAAVQISDALTHASCVLNVLSEQEAVIHVRPAFSQSNCVLYSTGAAEPPPLPPLLW